MVTKHPRISIIILNWNRWKDTIECLESVCALDYPDYEVVVIDNGSANNSAIQIKDWAKTHLATLDPVPNYKAIKAIQDNLPNIHLLAAGPRFLLLRSTENLGFAGGCNLGIDVAMSGEQPPEFVFLLNNDTRVAPDCLSQLIRVLRCQDAAIAGAVIRSADDGRVVFTGSRFPLELFVAAGMSRFPTPAEWWEVDRVMGSAMLIRRDLLELRKKEQGYYFDPDFFAYGEEVELCIWARKRGYKAIIVRDSVVYHKGTVSSGGEGSPLAYYYITRNRIRLAHAFLPFKIKLLFNVWYPGSRLARAAQRWFQNKPQVATAILEGLVDGYRGVRGKWRRHPDSL
jgi:GT2 family glycosyltransferase